jgi:hypothetical protein
VTEQELHHERVVVCGSFPQPIFVTVLLQPSGRRSAGVLDLKPGSFGGERHGAYFRISDLRSAQEHLGTKTVLDIAISHIKGQDLRSWVRAAWKTVLALAIQKHLPCPRGSSNGGRYPSRPNLLNGEAGDAEVTRKADRMIYQGTCRTLNPFSPWISDDQSGHGDAGNPARGSRCARPGDD